MNKIEKLYILIHASTAIKACQSRLIPEYHECPKECPFYYQKVFQKLRGAGCTVMYDYYEKSSDEKFLNRSHNDYERLYLWIDVLRQNIKQLAKEFLKND